MTKAKGFTIIELLVVILALVILTGVTVNMYTLGLDLWNIGTNRSAIRSDLSQSMELISKNLRQATSINALTPSSVTFTADLGAGSTTYRVYLYNASDPEPNPPYTTSTYELRWAQSAVPYGSGAILASDVVQPTNAPFSQSGNVVTLDFTVSRNDSAVRLRTNVTPRNL